PKNFSHFRGKIFPLKTPFSKLFFLKPFLEKRVSNFPKTFFLGTFFKKRFRTSKNFFTSFGKLFKKTFPNLSKTLSL
ncbi:MAG: hypothetical protein D6805_10000, partial [Planctomycetota bacterium]